MIDTALKRSATLTVPGIGALPRPTGQISSDDRRVLAWAYPIVAGVKQIMVETFRLFACRSKAKTAYARKEKDMDIWR